MKLILKIAIFVVLLAANITVHAQVTDINPLPKPQEIGKGFSAMLEERSDGKRFMYIKFPTEYTSNIDGYFKGILGSLVLVFKCTPFTNCIPEIKGKGFMDGYGRYAYVDTKTPPLYRIVVFPQLNTDNTFFGIAITLIEIPVKERKPLNKKGIIERNAKTRHFKD